MCVNKTHNYLEFFFCCCCIFLLFLPWLPCHFHRLSLSNKKGALFSASSVQAMINGNRPPNVNYGDSTLNLTHAEKNKNDML